MLREAGVAPRHIRRTVGEVQDHIQDLKQLLQQRGLSAKHADQMAAQQLGDLRMIAMELGRRRDLQRWYVRWPLAACLVYPIACLVVLPAVPVVAGVQNAASIARWAVCLLLSAGFTATLLLALQLSIRFS
jgi:hypothetical protein